MRIKDTTRAIDLNDYMKERELQHVRILKSFEKDSELYYEFVYNQRKEMINKLQAGLTKIKEQ